MSSIGTLQSTLARPDCRIVRSGGDQPHIPVLSPTAKQLESLLNDTERTCVVFGDSIFGRVFIASMMKCLESGGVMELSEGGG